MNRDVIQARIEAKIRFLKGEKVLLDFDLATLYGVTTAALNQAVSRNLDRFPEDFRSPLSLQALESLISQNVISKSGRGGRRKTTYAYTEQGVAMLSSVLRSKRAVQVNIEIMRAFVRLRRILASHHELVKKLGEMERRYEGQFKVVFEALRQMMPEVQRSKRKIGFK